MRFIISLILMFAPLLTSAQMRFTAQQVSVKTPYGQTEWQNCNDTVIFDLDRQKLTIYANPLQITRLSDFSGHVEDGTTVLSWKGIDQDDQVHVVTLGINKSYIILVRAYDDMEIWYNLKSS